jgi:hypothetical protein
LKVGDLIYDSHFKEHGIVVDSQPIPNQHGSWCTIFYEDGQIAEAIRSWEETIEVINASR